jgi:hypothetical protein
MVVHQAHIDLSGLYLLLSNMPLFTWKAVREDFTSVTAGALAVIVGALYMPIFEMGAHTTWHRFEDNG